MPSRLSITGIVLLLFLTISARSSSASWCFVAMAADSDGEKAKNEKVFAQLLKDYQAYGLPLPPKEAQLVRFPNGWSTFGAGGKATVLFHLGFLLEAADKKQRPLLLVGTREFKPDDEALREMKKVKPSVEAATN